MGILSYEECKEIHHVPSDLVSWALNQTSKTARIADRRGNTWELNPHGDTIVITGNALYMNRGEERSDLTSTDVIELAHFHNLPSASWMSTESMIVDSQAAFEKMITGLSHAISGVNLIWGAGNLESTLAMCPESLLVDNEIAGNFLMFKRGITVNAELMGLDLIREVGLGGDFISTEHTPAHYQQELSRSRMVFRNRRANWEASGKPTLGSAVCSKIKKILQDEPRVYLDASQERELERLEQLRLAELAR